MILMQVGIRHEFWGSDDKELKEGGGRGEGVYVGNGSKRHSPDLPDSRCFQCFSTNATDDGSRRPMRAGNCSRQEERDTWMEGRWIQKAHASSRLETRQMGLFFVTVDGAATSTDQSHGKPARHTG